MATNRSPNYPAVSLPDALELVTRLHQKEKRAAVDPELVVRAWGYSTLSGVARTKLSALRKYGLLDDTGKGMRVSDLAMAILFAHSDAERAEALGVAATTPELFRELASHPGASDDNLVSRLIRMGFTESGAKQAVASYRETMSIVPTEATGYTPEREPRHIAASASDSIAVTDMATVTAMTGVATGHGTAYDAGVAMSIGLPGGARVDLRVTSGTLTKEAIGLLRQYLDLVERSIPAAEAGAMQIASPVPTPDSSELVQPALQSPNAAEA